VGLLVSHLPPITSGPGWIQSAGDRSAAAAVLTKWPELMVVVVLASHS